MNSLGTICDYRARYYDPANGRFATEDPVHFGGYDNDFYRYVGNNPAKFNDPAGLDREGRRQWLDTLAVLNKRRLDEIHDPEIATRIAQYELAFKMQTSVPELVDLSDEPQPVLDLYGTQGADGTFAANCLLARRLAEQPEW